MLIDTDVWFITMTVNNYWNFLCWCVSSVCASVCMCVYVRARVYMCICAHTDIYNPMPLDMEPEVHGPYRCVPQSTAWIWGWKSAYANSPYTKKLYLVTPNIPSTATPWIVYSIAILTTKVINQRSQSPSYKWRISSKQ